MSIGLNVDPAVTKEQPNSTITLRPTSSDQAPPFNWIGSLIRAVPALFVFAMLGLLAYWGHHTGWKLPKFSELRGESEVKEKWCEEHNVPESICVECKPDLMPKSKPPKWCDEHGVPECPVHHPRIAQVRGQPELPKYDTAAALAVRDRVANDPDCKLHLRRIQLTSLEMAKKAGIDVDLVAERPMAEYITASAEVSYDPIRIARISSPQAGTVRWAPKVVGQRIARGEILALVDAAKVGEIKADFLQSLALTELRAQTVERLQGLKGTTSAQEIQNAESALREAQIRVAGTQQALANLGMSVSAEDFKALAPADAVRRTRLLGFSDADLLDGSGGSSELRRYLESGSVGTNSNNLLPLRSPIDGTIVSRKVAAGEVIDTSRSEPLYVVADQEVLWLTLHVRLEDIKYLKQGQKVLFRPDAGTVDYTSTIDLIASVVDERTRFVEVRAIVQNPKGELRANTFGNGRIVLREEPNAVTVLNEAVHWDGSCHIVFVRDKDYLKEGSPKVFHVRKVVPGATSEKRTELLAGVLPGEWVATKGSAALRGELLRANFGAG